MSAAQDREREIMLELVRVTETAALRAGRFMGTGDKNAVDGAAVDGMRGMLSLVNVKGTVIIGEGEKDEAPMLFNGEKVGSNDPNSVEIDIAVDPVEGTNLVASGLPNAISVLVAAEKGSLMPVPTFYMEKLAVGPEASGYIDIDAPIRENLRVVAAALGRKVKDLTLVILDRPRHSELINEIRSTGARIKLVTDGDVSGAIATALPDTGVDMLVGIGGAPEAVITAAAMKCLGGEIQTKIWARDEADRRHAMDNGFTDLNRVYTSEDLARGKNIIFTATGVTDGDMLKGVRYYGNKATTESLVMRMETGTLRRINTIHDLSRKTLISGVTGKESKV